MKGSKRERIPGVWELRVYNGVDPVTRNPRQVSRTVRGGARKADDALRDLIREVAAGKFRTTEGTVGFLLTEYLDQIEANGASPYTLRNYRGIVRNHLEPQLGSVPLKDLTAAQIDAYYRSLYGRLNPQTIFGHHMLLNAALNQAIDWDWLQANPAKKAKPPKVPDHDPTPPTPAEVVALIAEAERVNPSMAAFLYVAATTGARRGELCALRHQAVDLEAGTLLIAGSVVEMNAATRRVKSTKSGRPRRVALDVSTVEVLRRQMGRLEPSSMVNPFVFSADPCGRSPLRPGAATEFFCRTRDRLGLRHVRLHHLRHFMSTQALAGGADIRTVSGRLGHANPAMTLKVYSHFMPQQDREAADRMGALLQPGTVPDLMSSKGEQS